MDNFETAIRRDGKHKGYIIAFSFGSGAYEEAARAKRESLEIALIDVGSLLEAQDVEPRPGLSQMIADLYKAVQIGTVEEKPSRPKRTVAELVASERSGVSDA